MSEYIYRSNGEPLANERGEISLALAGEIVRCCDCVELRNGWLCAWFAQEVELDGFCAWGERKDNGNS